MNIHIMKMYRVDCQSLPNLKSGIPGCWPAAGWLILVANPYGNQNLAK
eukprot:COSAG01_NODE_300_length_19226_cov_41.536519_24_plen_48_part_00